MDEIVFPEYDGRSLLNIPSTIFKLFGVTPLKKALPKYYYQSIRECEKIVLLLLDRFGDNVFIKHLSKIPFLKKLKDRGIYHLGMHGGLSKDEMKIPYITVKISDLK
ncbi:hypothetical protein HYS91_03670 [Candidatus Daviesbacteria bacterium]|nr:hypothetical protein [Candidatus Daviesbacteria bacterium]